MGIHSGHRVPCVQERLTNPPQLSRDQRTSRYVVPFVTLANPKLLSHRPTHENSNVDRTTDVWLKPLGGLLLSPFSDCCHFHLVDINSSHSKILAY